MKKIFLIMLFILGAVGFVFAEPSVTIEPGQNIIANQVTIVTANTAVPLKSTETRILSVQIQPLLTNTIPFIFVGTSTVTTNSNDSVISSGAVMKLDVNDLNKIYINSNKAGEGVSYIAVTR